MAPRNLDVNGNLIKVGDWIADAGKNDNDRNVIRDQQCGEVLYADEHIIVVRPLTVRMKNVWGSGSVVFSCRHVKVLNEDGVAKVRDVYSKNEVSD